MRSLSAGLKFQNPQIFDIIIPSDELEKCVQLLLNDLAVFWNVFVIGQAVLRFEVISRIENPKA